MVGLTLAAVLLWCAAPLRRHFKMASTLLVVPATLVSALVYYLEPGYRVYATAFLVAEAVAVAAFDPTTRLTWRGARSQHDDPDAVSRPGVWPYALAATLIVWVGFRNLTAGPNAASSLLTMIAVLGIIASLYWADCAGLLNPAVFVWFASMFLSVALAIGGAKGEEWKSCSAQFEKCTIVHRLYTGIFTSENVLGEVAFLCLLLVFQTPKYKRRPLHVATFVVLLLIAGSRTPLVAIAVYVVIGALLALAAKRDGNRYRPPPVILAGVIAAITGGGLWLGYTSTGSRFSNRGQLWSQMAAIVRPTSLVGSSQAEYKALLDRGLFFGHYPTSEYMALMFFGGLIAVALFAAMLYSACVGASASTRGELALRIAPMICVALYGVLELGWSASTVDPTMWTLIAVLAAAAAARSRTVEPVEAAPVPVGRAAARARNHRV
ncbi:MAG TPA: hypothetical protein VGI86_13445 [Acidimicrobiia bacterium]